MFPSYLELDFDNIYPEPQNDQLAAAFFNRLWQKVNIYNFSILITLYGRHRVGKSLDATSFAHILDPTFEENLEKRVIYTSRGILDAFKEVRTKNIHGAAFVVDEAGSSDVSSQRWYEEAAKIVSAQLQSVGYLNPIIFFVTQDFSFINKTARKLSQGVFEVDRVTNKYSRIKPFWISNDPWSTKTYHKYPVFCYSRSDVPSNIYKINCIKICLPPDSIHERYNVHSQAFKDQLLEDGIMEIEQIDDTKQSIKREYIQIREVERVIGIIMKNPNEYKAVSSKPKRPRLDVALIQYNFHLSHRMANTVKKIAEHKLRDMEYVL